MTPYEKLKSLPKAKKYLEEGITFKKLDDISRTVMDNEAANYLQQQRKLLFNQLREGLKRA